MPGRRSTCAARNQGHAEGQTQGTCKPSKINKKQKGRQGGTRKGQVGKASHAEEQRDRGDQEAGNNRGNNTGEHAEKTGSEAETSEPHAWGRTHRRGTGADAVQRNRARKIQRRNRESRGQRQRQGAPGRCNKGTEHGRTRRQAGNSGTGRGARARVGTYRPGEPEEHAGSRGRGAPMREGSQEMACRLVATRLLGPCRCWAPADYFWMAGAAARTTAPKRKPWLQRGSNKLLPSQGPFRHSSPTFRA